MDADPQALAQMIMQALQQSGRNMGGGSEEDMAQMAACQQDGQCPQPEQCMAIGKCAKAVVAIMAELSRQESASRRASGEGGGQQKQGKPEE